MKTFLSWLNLIVALYVVVLVLVYAVCYFTGGGLSDTEFNICLYGLLGLMGLCGVGYILDPTAPPLSKRRRR